MQSAVVDAEARGSFHTQLVKPIRVDGDWIWQSLGGALVRRYAPDDEPGLLDAFLEVTTPIEAIAFIREFGFLGWHVIYREHTNAQASPLLREYRRLCASDQEGEHVTHVCQHAAILRWCQGAWKRQQDAAPTPLALHEVEPCPSPIAQYEGPLVPAAVAHILGAHVRHIRRDVSVHINGPALSLGWQRRALVDALYQFMAERLASPDGRLVACEECARVFHSSDPRQRFCPPRWWTDASAPQYDGAGRKRGSACYEKSRQRRIRAQRRAAGLTSRGSTPKRRQVASVAT